MPDNLLDTTASSKPAWARGYDLDALRALSARFRSHDEGMTLGAFSAAKENTVAEWLATGRLDPAMHGLLVARAAARPFSVKDFTGADLVRAPAGTLHAYRVAYASAAERASIIDRLAVFRSVVFESWLEHADDRALAADAGLALAGVKIRASSEMIGIWVRGISSVAERSPHEQVGVGALNLALDDALLRRATD